MEENIKITDEKDVTEEVLSDSLIGASEITFLPVMKSFNLPSSKVRVASSKAVNSFGCVLPPYNAAEIIRFSGLESTYQVCRDIKVDTTVGLGHALNGNGAKVEEAREFLKAPNGQLSDTFIFLIKSVYRDLITFHNAYIEFVKIGNRRSMYWVPAKDMYIKPVKENGSFTREISRYVSIVDNGYGKNTVTEYEPYPADGKCKNRVHYVIHFKKPNSDDLYYGNPDNKHLFDLIKLSYYSDQYNMNFFSNGAQPSWAIVITGGKLSSKSQENIKNFIGNNLKGYANAHKMLYLSVPNERATVQLIPLTKAIDEQFISLADKTQFKIALKCRTHPKMLGLSTGGNFGGGSAGMADMKLFIETVTNPDQAEFSELMNRFLLQEFGADCELVFKSMSVNNDKDSAIISNLYFNMEDEYGNRVMDVNDIRVNVLKLDPIKLKKKLLNPEGRKRISLTNEGDTRTSDNSSLDVGDGEAPQNLDSEKNKDEEV